MLDALGINRQDCFEKSDLIKKIEEYQQEKAAKKARNQRGSSTNATAGGGGSTNAAPDMPEPSGNFTYMPT